MDLEYDWLIENANVATFAAGSDGFGLTLGATVAVKDGRIEQLSTDPLGPQVKSSHHLDAAGRWLTPGLIDCHTHLVFAGSRAQEIQWRLQGDSYESIAARGGGILSTVVATRALSQPQLFDVSAARLERLLEEGVTTVEIKSGYGLDLENETKMLQVARALEEAYPVSVRTTFLGAHALAPEFHELGKQAYIDHICEDMLPSLVARNLVDAVDVFSEGIGFSVDQCAQVFRKAAELGLPIKAHAEQLSDLKGAVSAAQHGALSVDHLEYLASDDVAALQGSVAVLLPAAFYNLRQTREPPIAALRQHAIPMAVATDLNPGTAPLASLLTAVNQACILFGLSAEEALRGVTAHAAKALQFEDRGRIERNATADLLLWNIEHPAELAYGVNFHRPDCIWQAGQLVAQRS